MAGYRNRKSFAKVDRYQQVTDRIVEALERGVAPWVCPWDKAASGLPRNGHTGHVYRGINTWMCWSSGYSDPRWFTFNQVKQYGSSSVRKGEKGTPIVYWRLVEKKERDEETGNETTRKIPFLKGFTVFNYEQISWDPECAPKGVELREHDPCAENEAAAAFVAALGADLSHGGSRAFYRPSTDEIRLPEPGAFKSVDDYWSTSFHEHIHWTGASSRCDRGRFGRFGDESYAMEELVAELGAAFLCADLGVGGHLQHAEYVGNWIRVLKSDNRAIFTAQSAARKAVEWMNAKVGPAVATDCCDESDDEAAEAA